MVSGVRIKDHQREQRSFFQRTAVAAFVIVALMLVLLGRLVLLQIIRYDYYTDQAEGNRARIEPIPAKRGLILDRNGNVLAENQPSFQLELVREDVGDRKALDKTLAGLAKIGAIPADTIDSIRKDVLAARAFDAVPIRLRLSDVERAAFAEHRHEFPGVDVKARPTRYYPFGALAVHALGYVGAISETDRRKIDLDAYQGTTLIGKLGVEAAREKELHGVNGFQEILVNAQGRSVQGELAATLRSEPPQAGTDVILSLDLATQQAAEAAFGERRGAAVALDPHTGDVLALVSQPGFDPSMFGRGITTDEYRVLNNSETRPLFNRAIRGQYPAGSTVKPVMGMAGLAYGAITPNETRFCPGTFHLAGVAKPWREGRGGVHGALALREAIAKSCDVYFYALAHELEVDKIHDFMAPFGYGQKTGIDIAGEETGILPSKQWKRDNKQEAWYPGDSINMGIGQGFLTVTPIQQAHIAAVLAAKGTVFQPRLVTALHDPVSDTTTVIPPVELPHVKGGTPEQWDVIMDGMRMTMTIGTARGIQTSAEYHMAGKTGTAQAYSVASNERLDREVEENLRDHSWFIAFAPAEDPQIAVAVLVEHGGFGASVAAPIARKMMDAYLLPRLKPAQPPAEAPPAPAPKPAA